MLAEEVCDRTVVDPLSVVPSVQTGMTALQGVCGLLRLRNRCADAQRLRIVATALEFTLWWIGLWPLCRRTALRYGERVYTGVVPHY